ncbi:hypothetical protein BpHYR1_006723 [Brachionus plicatilis]|uniref:Uncharacterized protein n=1 Tax=Brachionus plicatilis TaxID=10195 RepID=A0A3M7RRK2_BRAPC|nr:hypothetical protein BpHYR1_006723 [Brachionus plicatilis]
MLTKIRIPLTYKLSGYVLEQQKKIVFDANSFTLVLVLSRAISRTDKNKILFKKFESIKIKAKNRLMINIQNCIVRFSSVIINLLREYHYDILFRLETHNEANLNISCDC